MSDVRVEAIALLADLEAGTLVPTNVRLGEWAAANLPTIIAALERVGVDPPQGEANSAPVRSAAQVHELNTDPEADAEAWLHAEHLRGYREGYADALRWALDHEPEEIEAVLDAE